MADIKKLINQKINLLLKISVLEESIIFQYDTINKSGKSVTNYSSKREKEFKLLCREKRKAQKIDTEIRALAMLML